MSTHQLRVRFSEKKTLINIMLSHLRYSSRERRVLHYFNHRYFPCPLYDTEHEFDVHLEGSASSETVEISSLDVHFEGEHHL